jgi:hypothetical protein
MKEGPVSFSALPVGRPPGEGQSTLLNVLVPSAADRARETGFEPVPLPAGQNVLPADGFLLVEAADETAAQRHFLALKAGQERQTLCFLSETLLFARAQASGRYWRFKLASD